jgi:hypothetical protein
VNSQISLWNSTSWLTKPLASFACAHFTISA